MSPRVDKLTALILRRIEELRVQHGSPGKPMGQKTLARRSGQDYKRVHKLIRGQTPYPPLDFLDALLRSFGTTLADELKGGTNPAPQRPIVRADIQEVADLLDDLDPLAVERLKGIAEFVAKAKTSGEATNRIDRTPGSGKTKAAGAKRSKRAARRPD